MWYIFNPEGNLIATTDQRPNIDDLASRGEIALENDEKIPFSEVIITSERKVGRKEKVIPTAKELKKLKLKALNRDFEPLFNSNFQAYIIAQMDNNEALMAELIEERKQFKAQYEARKEVL